MLNILYALIQKWNDKLQHLLSNFLSIFDMLMDQQQIIPVK